jgi:hypothetical protein
MRLAKLFLTGLLVGGVTLAAVVPASAAVGVFVGGGFGPRPWVRHYYGPRVGFYYNAPLYRPYPYPYVYPYGYYSAPPPPPAYYDEPPPSRDYAPPPSESQAPSWYYCQDPQGYYPYVQDCRGEWQEVPSAPPDQSAPQQDDLPPRQLQP